MVKQISLLAAFTIFGILLSLFVFDSHINNIQKTHSSEIDSLESQIKALSEEYKKEGGLLHDSSNSLTQAQTAQDILADEYIAKININTWYTENLPDLGETWEISEDDPFFKGLLRFGEQNPEAFLEYYLANPYAPYLGMVVSNVLSEEHSGILLNTMSGNVELVETALELNLHEQYPQVFRDELIAQLSTLDGVVSTLLLEFFAIDLVDTEDLSKLIDYASTGANKFHTLEVLSDLGYENISGLSTSVWKQAEEDPFMLDDYEKIMLSLTAAKHGSVEGLRKFVWYYQNSDRTDIQFEVELDRIFEKGFNFIQFKSASSIEYLTEEKKWTYIEQVNL